MNFTLPIMMIASVQARVLPSISPIITPRYESVVADLTPGLLALTLRGMIMPRMALISMTAFRFFPVVDMGKKIFSWNVI